MPRGGRRTGAQGRSYSNRTDLGQNRGPVPIQTVPGQQYGKATAQAAAQRALPIAPPPAPVLAGSGASPAPGPAAPPAPAGPMPGQVVPLDAPSQRPGEPVTAGLPVGPGPGTEALGPFAGQGEDVAMQLRAIYARFPNEDLRGLLELLDDE